MIKYTNKKVIEVSDWNKLVINTYNKPYNFQQQDGCQDRGSIDISIPNEEDYDEEMSETIPFQINGKIMGVKFQTWLSTTEDDINSQLSESYKGANRLIWERNFYPTLQTIANDMHKKGLIEAGDYTINIDW